MKKVYWFSAGAVVLGVLVSGGTVLASSNNTAQVVSVDNQAPNANISVHSISFQNGRLTFNDGRTVQITQGTQLEELNGSVNGFNYTAWVTPGTKLAFHPISDPMGLKNGQVIALGEQEVVMSLSDSTSISAVNPSLSQYVTGTLSPNTGNAYGPYFLTNGQKISESVSWTPSSSKFDLGVLNAATGVGESVTFSGGSGSITWQVNQSGDYDALYINDGPSTVNYSGYIS